METASSQKLQGYSGKKAYVGVDGGFCNILNQSMWA